MSETAAAEPAISARAITMRGPWGPVYGPIDLDIDAGGVTVLLCPVGWARTALLMTLAGRMRPASGSLTVSGRSRTRDIFGHAALAGIDDVDSVAESVTEATPSPNGCGRVVRNSPRSSGTAARRSRRGPRSTAPKSPAPWRTRSAWNW